MKKAHYVVGLLALVFVLSAVGLVFASSGGGHGEVKMVTHFGIEMNAKIWDLILRIMNFALLVGGLFFLLRKPVAKALEARRQGIKDQLDGLEQQKQAAERELAATKQKLTRLDQEAKAIVAEYVKEGEAAKAKILEQAKVAAERFQEQAKKNIEQEFQNAKEELKAEMADQAVALAEALIKKNINDDDQKVIIDEYLTKVVVAQ
jgi:F-type H+-transporting ATPase subunit b